MSVKSPKTPTSLRTISSPSRTKNISPVSKQYKLEWSNYLNGIRIVPSPSDALPRLVEQFGEPSFIDTSSDGVAIWKKRDLEPNWRIFSRIVLRDEFVLNTEQDEIKNRKILKYRIESKDLKEPELEVEYRKEEIDKSHYDFIKFYSDFYISEEMIGDVLMISKSVMYDRQKEQLIVRSNNYPRAIATFLLCAEIAKGDRTIEEVKENKLYKIYLSAVMSDETSVKKQNDFLKRYMDYLDQGYTQELGMKDVTET